MSKVKETNFSFKSFLGGMTFFPYQIAIGISIGFWPCISAPRARLYFGPLKLWLCYLPQRKEESIMNKTTTNEQMERAIKSLERAIFDMRCACARIEEETVTIPKRTVGETGSIIDRGGK